MQKGLIILVLMLIFLMGSVLAVNPSLNQRDFCQEMLQLHNWKSVTFPDAFPIQEGIVEVDYLGPAGFVKIENNSIVAAGCSSVTEFNYTLEISYAAAKNIVEAENPSRQYIKEKFKGNIKLKGTDWETKRNVRKLHRRAIFFPWLLR